MQRSSADTTSTVVPGSGSRVWKGQQKGEGVFLSDDEFDDDDDDSDLGMPLGSTTPTLTSAAAGGAHLGMPAGRPAFGSGARWARDRERAFLNTLKSPMAQEGFEATPTQAKGPNNETNVQEYETDEEEDYGQPVTR